MLFGTAAVLIRLLKDLDVFSIAFWRLVIAFMALAVTIFSLRKPFGFGFLKRNFVQVLLVNTTHIWSLLVSVLILGVKPARLAVLGPIISFLGVSIIAYADAASSAFGLKLKPKDSFL
jgi:drug/metabolite transporter (DMT)-like permease